MNIINLLQWPIGYFIDAIAGSGTFAQWAHGHDVVASALQLFSLLAIVNTYLLSFILVIVGNVHRLLGEGWKKDRVRGGIALAILMWIPRLIFSLIGTVLR